MAENPASGRMIIRGVTTTGAKFRPSDWAERLVGAFSSFASRGGRRPRPHPFIRVATINGINAVSVDMRLEESDPMAWSFLQRFASDNNLVVETPAKGDPEQG